MERLQDYAPDLMEFKIFLTVTEAEGLISSDNAKEKPMTFDDATLAGIIQQIEEQM